MAEEVGIRRLIGPVTYWLSRVCEAVDQPQEAVAFRSRSREAYELIAFYIPEASLRRTFLSTSEGLSPLTG